MPRYQVSPRGGTNPIDVVNSEGGIVKISVLQFKTTRIADAVAEELNRAYDNGVKEGVRKVADMLLSHPHGAGYGERQDGWQGAAKEVQAYQTGGLTD